MLEKTSVEKTFGFSIIQCPTEVSSEVYIAGIMPGGVADKDGQLMKGDKVLQASMYSYKYHCGLC